MRFRAGSRSDPKHLVFATIRGPTQFVRTSAGLQPQRVPSSVSDLIDAATRSVEGRHTWFFGIYREEDHLALQAGELNRLSSMLGCQMQAVEFRAKEFMLAYNELSTRVLWFAHHDLWPDLPSKGPRRVRLRQAWKAYERVNAQFAAQIAAASRFASCVIVNDYQLARLPILLRKRSIRLPIVQISYTPFSEPSAFFQLPRWLAHHVVHGMLGADLLAFASRRWVASFLACAERLGLEVNLRTGCVRHPLGVTWVRSYPVPIQVAQVKAKAATVRATTAAATVGAGAETICIARAERLDPAKNTLRGLLAFERLLDRRPDLRRRGIVLIACLVPSRESVPEYRWYAAQVMAAVERINTRHQGSIMVNLEENHEGALGVLRQSDVIFVNSVRDGMNLVAQEAVLVNERAGVLVLSSGVGCSDLLGGSALVVSDVRDIDETTNILEMAVSLSAMERQRRANALRSIVEACSVEKWITDLLADLFAVTAEDSPTSDVSWDAD